MAKVDPLKCGNCGNKTFELRHVTKNFNGWTRVGGQGSGGFEGKIRVVCTKCKETSTIEVSPARLNVSGSLCGGWGS